MTRIPAVFFGILLVSRVTGILAYSKYDYDEIQTVPEGGTIHMTCEGSRDMTFDYPRSNSPTNRNTAPIAVSWNHMEGMGYTHSFTRYNVSIVDSGPYRCYSSNDKGPLKRSIFFQVTPAGEHVSEKTKDKLRSKKDSKELEDSTTGYCDKDEQDETCTPVDMTDSLEERRAFNGQFGYTLKLHVEENNKDEYKPCSTTNPLELPLSTDQPDIQTTTPVEEATKLQCLPGEEEANNQTVNWEVPDGTLPATEMDMDSYTTPSYSEIPTMDLIELTDESSIEVEEPDMMLRTFSSLTRNQFHLTAGEDFEWTVEITSESPHTIQWIHPNGSYIVSTNPHGKFVIDTTTTYSSLYIRDLEFTDNGIYVVEARSLRFDYQLANLTMMLFVYGPPEITIHGLRPYFLLGERTQLSFEASQFATNGSCQLDQYTRARMGYRSTSKSVLNVRAKEPLSKIFEGDFNITMELLKGTLICQFCNDIGCNERRFDVAAFDMENAQNDLAVSGPHMIDKGDSPVFICGAGPDYLEIRMSVGNFDPVQFLKKRSEDGSWIEKVEEKKLNSSASSFMLKQRIIIHNITEQYNNTLILCVGVVSPVGPGGIDNKPKGSVAASHLIRIREQIGPETVHSNLDSADLNSTFVSTYVRKVELHINVKPPRATAIALWYLNDTLITPSDKSCILGRKNHTLTCYWYITEMQTHKYSYTVEGHGRMFDYAKSIDFYVPEEKSTPMFDVIRRYSGVFAVIFGYMYYVWSLRIKRRKTRRLELSDAEQRHIVKLECDTIDAVQEISYDVNRELSRKDLTLGQVIAGGVYGEVRIASAVIQGEMKTVAVKMSDYKSKAIRTCVLYHELKKRIQADIHPNLVNFIGACTSNLCQEMLYVVYEHCPLGSLHSYLVNFKNFYVQQVITRTPSENNQVPTIDEDEIRDDGKFYESGRMLHTEYKGDYDMLGIEIVCTVDLLVWAMQVAKGMAYLTEKNLVHGDLQTKNILLSHNKVAKITNFGLPDYVHSTNAYTLTEIHDCPDVFRWLSVEAMRDCNVTKYSDVWSYGVLLWELFTLGDMPYGRIAASDIYRMVHVEGKRLPKPEKADEYMYQDIMLECWKKEPQARPSFTKLEGIMFNLKNELRANERKTDGCSDGGYVDMEGTVIENPIEYMVMDLPDEKEYETQPVAPEEDLTDRMFENV